MRLLCSYVVLLSIAATLHADEFNYDEAKIPDFELPQLLTLPDGREINSPALWRSQGRPHWLNVVADEIYGHQPAEQVKLSIVGTDGLDADTWPEVNTPISSRIGYHLRPGKHDVKLQDWQVYMDFADKHLPN